MARLSAGRRKSAIPKASRARCFRFAPQRPRWTSHFRQPASPCELAGRLSTAVGPGLSWRTCDRLPISAITGPGGARQVRRDLCGLDRRAASPHLQRNVIPRPPLPAPYLKMLIRHPSVARRDASKISAPKRAGISIFAKEFPPSRQADSSESLLTPPAAVRADAPAKRSARASGPGNGPCARPTRDARFRRHAVAAIHFSARTRSVRRGNNPNPHGG